MDLWSQKHLFDATRSSHSTWFIWKVLLHFWVLETDTSCWPRAVENQDWLDCSTISWKLALAFLVASELDVETDIWRWQVEERSSVWMLLILNPRMCHNECVDLDSQDVLSMLQFWYERFFVIPKLRKCHGYVGVSILIFVAWICI